jgi:hypothetical protein
VHPGQRCVADIVGRVVVLDRAIEPLPGRSVMNPTYR